MKGQDDKGYLVIIRAKNESSKFNHVVRKVKQKGDQIANTGCMDAIIHVHILGAHSVIKPVARKSVHTQQQ